MCRHETIGYCTALIEARLIEYDLHAHATNIKLETPSGIVEVEVKLKAMPQGERSIPPGGTITVFLTSASG